MTSRGAGRPLILPILAALAIAHPADAGPGEAGRGGKVTGPHRPDFMVVVWYRGDDALGTFRYQTYDVRRGEYTPAVEDWLAMMRAKYPHYEVRALPVDLARERGATENLKVGSVIRRELLLAAARAGVIVGGPMRIGPGPSVSQRPGVAIGLGTRTPGAGGASGLNVPGNTSPFPVPYPRPHP